jgi:gliding motility-associated-like protein
MKRILLPFLLLIGFSLMGMATPPAPSITSFFPAAGPVGTLVTIQGSDLSGPTAITIGGAAAIVISNTGNSLVAMVMPGAGAGNITVTTAGGHVSSSSSFRVTPPAGPNTQQGNKLVGTGNTVPASQGFSVAISGDGNTAIVGGTLDDQTQGASWIFVRSGGVWTQQGSKLVGTGTVGQSRQGQAVAISADGNTAIVGGFVDDTYIGAAWIFTRNGSSWTQQGNKLVGNGYIGNPSLGMSVALSADGNTALVGGRQDNNAAGAVWVFTRSGGVWTQQGNKVTGTGSIGVATLGAAVALSADGKTMIAGGHNDNNGIGASWIFTRNGNTWTQQGNKLVGTGWIKKPQQGASVAISADGNTAIVGGASDNSSVGAAWIFTRNGNTWTQQGSKLVSSDTIGLALQGTSVALSADGNIAVVGAGSNDNGAGILFVYSRSGNTWTQRNTLVGTGYSGVSNLGNTSSLSADGNTVISSGNADNNTNGASWIFNYISHNARLSALAISTGSLSPAFNPAVTTYTASVGVPVSSVTVTPTEEDINTTIAVQVNGGGYTTVASGNPSPALPLNAGANTVDVKVTAQDGSTVKIYTVTVNREPQAQTIVFAPLPNSTYGDADFNLTATGGLSGNAITYTSSNPLVATVNGNTVKILSTGTTNITASQPGNSNYHAATDVIQLFTVSPKAISVTANVKNKTYGDMDPLLTYTATPALIAGDAFTGELNRIPGENAGTYAIHQNTLALDSNYILTYTGANLTISVKTITVTADTKSKTYGDADPTLTYTATPALIGGDVFTGELNRAPGENTGSYVINQHTLSLNPNYVINYNNALLTIGTKTINVTAEVKSKTYGDTDPTLSYTATPALVSGDVFTGELNRDPGENTGSYVINQQTLSLNPNYVINYTNAHLTIGTKKINVTAEAKSKTYGDTDPTLTYTATPALVGGDAFTGELNRDPGENTGSYVINQHTLSLNPNYVISYSDALLTISTKTINVTADTKSKTYGDTDPTLTYIATPALVSGDVFTGELSRDPGENTGSYAINQHTLSLNPNYVINYSNAHLTIGTKTIKVTAEAKSKTYGDTDPTLTYTATPALVSGDAFTGELNRAPGENKGIYVINQHTLSLNPNYVISYSDALLTISTKTINVTAEAKSKTYGDADPTLTYTATPALVSGDAFTGELNRAPGENKGSYVINQHTLSLNPNYVINYNNALLTIGTKTINVTAEAKSKTYGDPDPALTYIATPALVSGDMFTGELNRAPGENKGSYVINQHTLSLNPNYVINYSDALLTISTKTINVTAEVKNKTYGDTDPTLTYIATPALVSGDAFTGELNRDPGENKGSYVINQHTLSLNPNYVINYSNALLTIGTKTINVTADTKSKTYGDTDPTLTYIATPALVSGDVFTGELSRDPGENTGSYAINQHTLSLNPNYVIHYIDALLTIGKKILQVSVNDASRVYGEANPAWSASYSGFAGTDNEAVFTTPLVFHTAATINTAPGDYAITASGATATNYDIQFIDGNLHITKNTQTIHFPVLPNKLSTDVLFTLAATTSSALPISYVSSDPTVADIVNGNQVKILQAGSVTITANQEGNANYVAAAPVAQSLTIIDNPAPVVMIQSNRGNSISKGETVVLTASGANTYQWDAEQSIIGGINMAVLTVRPSVTTTYTVTGKNKYGRASTQTFTLNVKADLHALSATNILSPNGDGINDYWIVKNIDMYPENEVKIFDRAGRIVYTKKGYNNTWGATANGSRLAEGTYYYIIDLGKGVGIMKGFITIVR